MARRINKPIEYEAHAIKRGEQRDISRTYIEEAISNPHSRRPAKRDDGIRVEYKINGTETLSVIYRETKEKICVITAWIHHA